MVADSTIGCPKCGARIELTEALTGEIEQGLRAGFESEVQKREQALAAKSAQLAEQQKKLAQQHERLEDEIQARLARAKEHLTATTLKRAHAEHHLNTEALEKQLAEQQTRLKAAQAQELSLLEKQRLLEEKTESLELEVARRIGEERQKIAEQAGKRAAQEQQLKMREKEDLIKSLESKLGDLQRKIELGSQERQGEALEGQMQELLERSFPVDNFAEIKKGARGADLLQTVRNAAGSACGTILWETKNTQEFQRSWIEKLKKDQQEAGADVAVIMTVTLPKALEQFGMMEEVWITDHRSAVGLATALRVGLLDVARQKRVSAGQESMKDVVYQYVTGQEFALHIKAVVTAFGQMQGQLDREKRAMQRIWKEREKQIAVVLDNVIGMRGSLEGLVGTRKSLPNIDSLTLEGVINGETDSS